MLPFLLITHASLASWRSTEGWPAVDVGPQNTQPMVRLKKAQDAQHVWLSDESGEVVVTERVQEDGWIKLIPPDLLEPGSYFLHSKDRLAPLQVQSGVDAVAPNGGASFEAQAWRFSNDSFHLRVSGERPQDPSAVALQLQVYASDAPLPPSGQVDAMAPGNWLTQDFEGDLDRSLFRARWIDAAGNRTEWSRPERVGAHVYDGEPDTKRQLIAAGTGLIALMISFLAWALLSRERAAIHRSPVGLRSPIPPGPR